MIQEQGRLKRYVSKSSISHPGIPCYTQSFAGIPSEGHGSKVQEWILHRNGSNTEKQQIRGRGEYNKGLKSLT